MTPTAQVTAFLLIHLGVILVVTAYYTTSAAIAPRLTERARLRLARRPWLPVLIGLLVSGPWVLAALVLLSLPAGGAKFLGVVIGCLWIFCGLVGGGAIAQHVGRPAQAGHGPDLSWLHSVRGGLLITLTWVLPFIGWMGMLPLTLASGVGCLITGLFPMAAAPRGGVLAGDAAPLPAGGMPVIVTAAPAVAPI